MAVVWLVHTNIGRATVKGNKGMLEAVLQSQSFPGKFRILIGI
jgi:hypothetical protein